MMILEARSKSGFGFRRLGLKTGVKTFYDILWSELGSGFEDPGGTPPQEIPGVSPPVQNLPCWRARNTLGEDKQRKLPSF